MKNVDVYWSHQSPYCYFALDRILRLRGRSDVDINLKPVLPGVIRNPEVFYDEPEVEQQYFVVDTHRTAAFLGLPYDEANPYPVEFQPNTLYHAAEEQPRVNDLYYLTEAANDLGQGWEFLDGVTRLIWDGHNKNWHKGNKLEEAIESVGIDYRVVRESADANKRVYDQRFANNHEELLALGHNGVPTFGYKNEAFFGQDRFDQLLWRMGVTLP